MSWRTVCITRRAKLELHLGALIVRGEETVKIHLSEISAIIIESTAVSLTCSLLAELTRQKIKVVFCDEHHNPSSELLPYYGSHDTSNCIRKQIAWNNTTKDVLWTRVVYLKVLNQYRLLEMLNKVEAGLLAKYLEEIELADITNREGHAAKVYFNALFGRGFTRGAADAVNAALDYGYTLLLSIFNREIVVSGCITQVGIGHNNQFNQFNFASDLMEPFRPFIDREVVNMYSIGFEFGKDEKISLIRILESDVRMDGKIQKLNYAVRLFVQRIIRQLNEDLIDQIPDIGYV